jgi:type I restriction enzyme M protein
LFAPLKKDYFSFTEDIAQKEDIKKLIDESAEVKATQVQYSRQLTDWWNSVVKDFESLPENKNMFELYRKFSESFSHSISGLQTGQKTVLDEYQGRGALAAYWSLLNFDLKSVAASGWNAELIPDDEILESQFPDILKELGTNEARKEELENIFKEVNELEEGTWTEVDYEAWPKDELKDQKEVIKALKGERKESDKEYKNLLKRIKAGAVDGERLKVNSEKLKLDIEKLDKQINIEEARIARHSTLEDELKQCRKVIKEIKDKKQNLVETARERILPEEAKELILKRLNTVLHSTINGYLQTHSRQLLISIELLYSKYTTPLHNILSEREKETELLNNYLIELGYE